MFGGPWTRIRTVVEPPEVPTVVTENCLGSAGFRTQSVAFSVSAAFGKVMSFSAPATSSPDVMRLT